MSSALEAMQQVLVASLQAHSGLTELVAGIFDGPRARAPFPYVTLATGASRDWSHKTATGRELSLAMAVHDDGRSAARLHRVMALVEEALANGLEDPTGWQLVTFDFRRTRIVRRAAAPWTGLIEYRALCLETSQQ